MVDPTHLPTLAAGHRHPPGNQVVDASAPAHRALAACVFGYVAAYRGSPGAGGVGCKYQAPVTGKLVGFVGNNADLKLKYLGHSGLPIPKLKFHVAHAANTVKFFGVNHHAVGAQWNRAAGQPRPAAARHGFQSHLGNGCEQRRQLFLLVRHHHRHRQIQTPVGRIGGMGYQRERVEQYVINARNSAQLFFHAAAQARHFFDITAKIVQQLAGSDQHLMYFGFVSDILLDDT